LIRYGVVIGDLLSIEGRAIKQAYQGNGIGRLALIDLIGAYDIQAAASVTRNPAIPRLMLNGFKVVSPNPTQPNPLHAYRHNDRVRAFTEVYAEHINAETASLPIVPGRYEGGLYGYTDPGRNMGIPEIEADKENGVIMVAIDRREDI
jgi:hypothetical protein